VSEEDIYALLGQMSRAKDWREWLKLALRFPKPWPASIEGRIHQTLVDHAAELLK
jgi:hypothetical protein